MRRRTWKALRRGSKWMSEAPAAMAASKAPATSRAPAPSTPVSATWSTSRSSLRSSASTGAAASSAKARSNARRQSPGRAASTRTVRPVANTRPDMDSSSRGSQAAHIRVVPACDSGSNRVRLRNSTVTPRPSVSISTGVSRGSQTSQPTASA